MDIKRGKSLYMIFLGYLISFCILSIIWIFSLVAFINISVNKDIIKPANYMENQVEKLKLENNQLAKNYKNVKNDYDKLNKDYNELSENLESSVIKESAITQISFEGINGNDLVEDILELDILSMTPLDAMNALFNLQKKAKDKK